MTERITLELKDEDALVLEHLIDKKKIKNKKEAIMLIIRNSIAKIFIKEAFILAGGKGTRMRPFTYEIPKALIPVKGKPILEYILELLRKYEIRNAIISVGYLGQKIQEYFGDGSKFGMNITYIEEREEFGTAGPLRLAEEKLRRPFLMFNGDVLSNINLNKLIKFHLLHKGLATVTLVKVPDVSNFGTVKMDGNKISQFVEKPNICCEGFINAGIYVLDPKVISYVPKGFSMIEKDVFPRLASEGKLFGYKFQGQWFDTGTHEAYEKAIKEWRGINLN
ncbi:MAG: nucleotidyltransferase family protein [Candidatus Altiarchaeota archaeon]